MLTPSHTSYIAWHGTQVAQNNDSATISKNALPLRDLILEILLNYGNFS